MILFLHFLLCHIANAEVPAIIVFGDSSVDAGNNDFIDTIAKSNFEPYGRDFQGGKPTGRFCNGRIPTDFMSEAFGIKPIIPAYLDTNYGIQDFATGVCFASAATGYDNSTANVLSVLPLWKQVEYFEEYQTRLRGYLGKPKANEVLREALYVLSIGTNDFLENYYTNPIKSYQYTIEEYQSYLLGIAENFITEIYHLGARKMDLTGIPPMGCLPLERTMNFFSGSNCNEDYNTVARDFNTKLRGMADKLNRKLPEMRILFADVYVIVQQVIHAPLSYGFENAVVGCCATGIFEMGYTCNKRNPFTCTDPKKYVFWDAIHPTEEMNKIVADFVMNTMKAFL